MLVRDFNVIADPSESSNSSDSFVNSDFTDCKIQLSVLDHVFTGPVFTWTNKHSERFISKKLDRVLINDVWLSKFASSTVEFLPPEVSDHSPMIHFEQVKQSPPKPFKFFNFWTKHQDFMRIVALLDGAS